MIIIERAHIALQFACIFFVVSDRFLKCVAAADRKSVSMLDDSEAFQKIYQLYTHYLVLAGYE